MFPRERIAVMHSRITPAAKTQRLDAHPQRRDCAHHRLAIGALFAPCRTPGLIIIDEEHEWTYKNEQTPRYNTRDLAEKLCSLSGAATGAGFGDAIAGSMGTREGKSVHAGPPPGTLPATGPARPCASSIWERSNSARSIRSHRR
jgi:hypothetical protein